MTAALPASKHPAPARGEVSPSWLIAGLAIPPAAWIVELLLGVGIASNACPLTGGLGPPEAFAGESGVMVAIILACLAATVASGIMSRRHWLRVRHEKNDSEHSHLTIGEGRTRFMAVTGMLSAVTFSIAILFNLLEPLVIPLCWNVR